VTPRRPELTGVCLDVVGTTFQGTQMKPRAWLLLVFFFFLAFSFTLADDDDKNHHHHEDLNEAALGTVHFETSCAASVQKPFARGVALLHSFWYEESEKEFLDIAKDDPHCAMAHWGVAMSLWHQLWDTPDEKVIKRGLKEVKTGEKLAKKSTPRERFTAIRRISNTPPAPRLIPTQCRRCTRPIPRTTKPPLSTRSR
jgi:hypothetical protein